jgi:hypothetical protein
MRKADGDLSRTGRTSHLIRQARGGSAEALGRLLERSRAYLLLIANKGLDADLRSKGGASDLVQQTSRRSRTSSVSRAAPGVNCSSGWGASCATTWRTSAAATATGPPGT